MAAVGLQLVVFAHAGHWLASLAYAAPVLALLVWMAILKVRERRSTDPDAPPPTDRD